jgi:hypothetical protein
MEAEPVRQLYVRVFNGDDTGKAPALDAACACKAADDDVHHVATSADWLRRHYAQIGLNSIEPAEGQALETLADRAYFTRVMRG